MVPGYVDTSQIAKLLNISTKSMTYQLKENKFPNPDETVGRKNLWKVETVEAYFRDIVRKNEEILEKLQQYKK
jgi:hypothetical protein